MVASIRPLQKSGERPLYEQVRDHLRSHCAEERPNVALPSLRQLSESMGINHITISRALRELESEGVLRIVPGKGTFVAESALESRAVELLTFYSQRLFMMDTSRHFFAGMQSAMPDGYSLAGSTVLLPPVPRPDVFLQGLKIRQVSAVALFGYGYQAYPDSLEEAQLIHDISQQVPVVLVGKEHSVLRIPCIYCDPAPQMVEYLETAFANGSRRFEYLGAGDDQPHLKHRLNAFQEFLLEHGLRSPRRAADEPESNTALAHQILERNPEVIVVSTSARAHSLVIEAQRRGLQPGQDLEILCFAGSIEEVEAIANYVNVVVLEEEAVGRRAMEHLHQRLQDPNANPPAVETVPGRLVRRGVPIPVGV